MSRRREPMSMPQSPKPRPSEMTPALLLGEFNHRIGNLLQAIEAVVGESDSANVEDYRATLMTRISGLVSLHEAGSRPRRGRIGFVDLLEQTMRPHSANGARVLAAGPDF